MSASRGPRPDAPAPASGASASDGPPLRVLTLSARWPSAAAPQSHLESEERMRRLQEAGQVVVRVVSPARRGVGSGRGGVLPALEKRAAMVLHHPQALSAPWPARSLNDYLYARSMRRFGARLAADKGGFDLIDAHAFLPDGWGARILAAKIGAAYVVTAWRSAEELAALRGREAERVRAIAAGAARLFTLGQAQADALAALGAPRDKIVVTRNGVDLQTRQAPAAREGRAVHRRAFGLPESGPLAAVRIDDGEAEPVALAAAARRPDLAVAVFGDGSTKGCAVARQARERLGARAHLLGSLRPQRAAALLAGCDLSIYAPAQPSSWPTGLLESLACGAPVAATPALSVEEVTGLARGGAAGPAGAVAAAREPEALAAAVDAVLAAEIAPQAARAHAARFDWDAPIRDIGATLRAVAAA